MEHIRKRICDYLEENNIKSSQLCEILGLKKSPLTDWKNEHSRPTLAQIIAICENFGISSDYLLFGKSLKCVNLSTEDRELLSLFNELNNDEKKICLAYLKGFIDNERRHTAVSDPQIKIVGK